MYFSFKDLSSGVYLTLLPHDRTDEVLLRGFALGKISLKTNSNGKVIATPVASETAAGNDSEAEINRVNALLEAYDKGWAAATKQFSALLSPQRNGFGQDIDQNRS
jgi:hypothetical protein